MGRGRGNLGSNVEPPNQNLHLIHQVAGSVGCLLPNYFCNLLFFTYLPVLNMADKSTD